MLFWKLLVLLIPNTVLSHISSLVYIKATSGHKFNIIFLQYECSTAIKTVLRSRLLLNLRDETHESHQPRIRAFHLSFLVHSAY